MRPSTKQKKTTSLFFFLMVVSCRRCLHKGNPLFQPIPHLGLHCPQVFLNLIAKLHRFAYIVFLNQRTGFILEQKAVASLLPFKSTFFIWVNFQCLMYLLYLLPGSILCLPSDNSSTPRLAALNVPLQNSTNLTNFRGVNSFLKNLRKEDLTCLWRNSMKTL